MKKQKENLTKQDGNFDQPNVSGSLPDDWKARPIDLKSGWKNNAKILAEIVTAINNDIYIEDESAEMEKIDIVLEWIKKRYGK